MSQTTSGQNIFGDQTNVKPRCLQPPGGTSSINFGSSQTDIVKTKTNHQASDIFNTDENFDHHGAGGIGKKSNGPHQQEDTQSNLFGETGEKQSKLRDKNGFNPITGESNSSPSSFNVPLARQDDENKKVITPLKPVLNSRQPPGGKSSKLW